MNNNLLFAIVIVILGGFIVAPMVKEFRAFFMVLKNGAS